MEFDAVAQPELVDAAIGRNRNLIRRIGVDRIGFVGGAAHQRAEHQLHVDRWIAFEDEAVQ
jgi:hypothetical protein